jgi:hypothetical protein
MSIADHRADHLIRIEFDAIPVDAEGLVLLDLFIELPTNARFIRFLAKGSLLEISDINKIRSLSRPYVFVNRTEWNELKEQGFARGSTPEGTARTPGLVPDSEGADETKTRTSTKQAPSRNVESEVHRSKGDAPAEKPGARSSSVSKADLESGMLMQFGKESAEFLKKPIAHELSKIFYEVILPNPGEFTLEDTPIAEMSSRLLDIIAPDVDNFRSHFRRIPQYLSVMDDSAAVTTIAVLYAVALGQTSRSVFRDLSYACLLMDFALLDLSAENWNLYYQNRSQLSPEMLTKVQNHPRRSYEIVQKKFTRLPEIVGQLILGHHELFNGRGYPRGIRSELLAPLVRMFACAVDTFEIMKQESLHLSNPSLLEVLSRFIASSGTQPHERRHSLTLVRQIHQFLTDPVEGEDSGSSAGSKS